MGEILPALWAAAQELALFATAAFLINGVSDLAIDVIWITRGVWRRLTVYRRHDRATLASLHPARGPVAIFVTTWHEAGTIGPMLDATLARLPRDIDWTVWVGVYANDPATMSEVAARRDARLRMVVNDRPGPTTKGDNLNSLWRALAAAGDPLPLAVVLHDAEDVVHPGEPRLFATLNARFDLVQIPVVPIVERMGDLVGGAYLDEFLEHHTRTMVVREAIGAGVPAAGVGCGIRFAMLEQIAARRGGDPFSADSLTEDYELGLRIKAAGGSTIFVRIADAAGALVAVHACFPDSIAAAVRQKSRWVAGIALHGWDRLGWRGGVAETWMRWRDRWSLIAALATTAGYLAALLGLASAVLARSFDITLSPLDDVLQRMIVASMLLLAWRLAVRMIVVARAAGWRHGLLSIPRSVVSSIIAILAARGALVTYLRARHAGRVVWDKTDHRFPTLS